ncbi:hypothetical protein [Aquimarina spongiae]|uniref:Uncharacterized protein n=1 Tax=Aquimarina spongiae TaxID=570521 RepID=A0A1M6GLG2_9FLAO|nr:hypothetical protein [Aquimarina spongiae]SHJ10753.1 hypothetical protein SAMN04488508_105338 [Aquimarina spongiae]
MKANLPKNEKYYIKKYADIGYATNFYFEKNKIVNSLTKCAHKPKDISIVAQHRFEGIRNPANLSILYIMEDSDGYKGSFLVSYGAAANQAIIEFFNHVPEQNISNKAYII